MSRVLLDTNVLLMGAIWRGSYAEALADYRDKLSFLTASYCISEAEAIFASRTTPEVAACLIDLLDDYLRRLDCVVVPRQDLPPEIADVVSGSDLPVFETAVGVGVDCLCTYNTKDFPKTCPEVLSPLGILRSAVDPRKYLVLVPVLGREGTLMVGTRQYGDDRLGLLLETGALRITQTVGKSIVAEGSDLMSFHPTRHVVPDGYGHAIVVRYRSAGDFDIKAWPLDAFPDELPVGSTGALLLATGTAAFSSPVTPGLSLGRPTGLQGECFFISGIPQYLRDGSLRGQALRDRTLEGVLESQSIKTLLSMCDVRLDSEGQMVLEVQGRAFSRLSPSGNAGST